MTDCYISPAADLYLAEERPEGVACVTGMPQHPVYYWTREGGWDGDPHGRQSADIRYEHDAALDYAYEGQDGPEEGHEITVIDSDRDNLVLILYRCVRAAGEDDDGEFHSPAWREVERRDVDLRAWVVERLRRALDDELLAAAADLGLVNIED